MAIRARDSIVERVGERAEAATDEELAVMWRNARRRFGDHDNGVTRMALIFIEQELLGRRLDPPDGEPFAIVAA